jgi:hypothetical protein
VPPNDKKKKNIKKTLKKTILGSHVKVVLTNNKMEAFPMIESDRI